MVNNQATGRVCSIFTARIFMDLEAIPYFTHDLSYLERFRVAVCGKASGKARLTGCGKIGMGDFEKHIFVRGTTHT